MSGLTVDLINRDRTGVIVTDAIVDYYALLGVARTATRYDLEQAIKQGIRTWSKQTGRPELDRRQEAERKMQQLKEAREILLDDGRRAQYDQRLATAQAPAGPAGAAPSTGGEWLALARNAMTMNDFRTAARAAQEARRVDERSAEAWSVLARANAGLGRHDDAVFEAQRALQLAPDNLEYRYTLAEIFEQLGDWTNALQTYQSLSRLDPESALPQIGTASVYLSSGAYQQALDLLEWLFASGRDRAMVGYYLAMALLTAAENVPRVRDDSGYAITARYEISQMGALLDRAEQVTGDPELLASIADMREYMDRCAGSEIIWGRIVGRWGLRYLIVVVVSVCLAGFAHALWPFAVLAVIGGGVGLVLYAWVPRWRLNQLSHQGRYLWY
jgi:tetratricopeptide (TPR) repeat protein